MEAPQQIYEQVQKHYSAASQQAQGASAAKYGEAIAKSFGYSEAELSEVPEGANLGLSCGNPLAIASLREGETVIDFGSGAGFDIFQASPRVGPSGRAIGVDMNDDMLARANAIRTSKDPASVSNISFVKGLITSVPLESEIADCIISNCVVNLVPAAEKPQVFNEMYRLLKPNGNGRIAISDVLAKKELPEQLRQDVAMYVGCIAGASLVEEYEGWLRAAGFEDIIITDTKSDLNAYVDLAEGGTDQGCCGPLATAASVTTTTTTETACCGGIDGAASAESKPKPESSASCCTPGTGTGGSVVPPKSKAFEKTDLNEWVGSYKIYAVKK